MMIETFAYQLLWPWQLLAVLLFLAAALIGMVSLWQRRGAGGRKSLLGWLSHLPTFSQNFGQSSYPRDMAEAALSGTLRAFDLKDGLVLLEGEEHEGLSHVGTRGLSARATEVFSAEPVRKYLATLWERRGNPMVFSGLRKSDPPEEWQSAREYNDLAATLKMEGLKSLLVIGLVARGRTYGMLLVGRRYLETFSPEEMQLATAISNQVGAALDNWRLVRTGDWHNEDLRVLDQVGRTMRETFDLNEQMATLRQNMKNSLGGCVFAFAMQDLPGGPVKTVVPFEHYSQGGSPAEQTVASLEAVSVLEEEVVNSRAPRLIGENWQWTKYPSSAGAGTRRIRTWCGVPIHFSDGCVGVLEVASFEHERAISTQQFELIRVLANEAAGAFENARTFQREQGRARHLSVLNEIVRKVTTYRNPKELLANVCIQVRNDFGYDLARVEIWDRKSDELVVEAEAGYGNELLGHRTPMSTGLSGAAAESREPVVTNRVGPELKNSMLAQGVRSSVSLRLEFHGELLGVLTLECRREQAFPDQDVLMLKTLADVVSNALHNAREYQNALEEAITDGLTGLKTHRFFMEALERELGRSQRTGRPFSIIMMDLDRFKLVNDQHGHSEGDSVLSGVAKLLMGQVRQSSVLARYGGDEFSVLLSDATLEQARCAAERLRESIEKDPLLVKHQLTASFGIATCPEHGTTHTEILQVADSGMYLAKHEGGNRVRVATRVPDSGQVEAYLSVEYKRKFSGELKG